MKLHESQCIELVVRAETSFEDVSRGQSISSVKVIVIVGRFEVKASGLLKCHGCSSLEPQSDLLSTSRRKFWALKL